MERINLPIRRTSLVNQDNRAPLYQVCPRAMAAVEDSAIMVGMESTLHLLGYEVYLASVSKDSLSAVTHKLLQLLLRLFNSNPEARRNHFFSFTETSTDYSMILDSQLLQLLNIAKGDNKIEVVESKWRPLVVEVGALGSLSGISKIAASVIGPLADQGVSVFCLSTNQDDFVLVKEESLERALASLSRDFKLVCDSEGANDIALVEAVEKKANSAPRKKHKSCLPHSSSHRPIIHPYICSPVKLSVCSIVPTALPSVGSLLLDLMLFNKRSPSDDMFFSLSMIDGDISMVLDSRDIEKFPEDSLYTSEGSWRRIRIGEGPLGFEECGIVAQMSAPLAQMEISIYYICTYYTDHTLVPEECVEKSLQLLNDREAVKVCSKNGFSRLADAMLDSPTAVFVNRTQC